jgi:hypothetical protein
MKDHQPYAEIAWNYDEDVPQHKGKGRTKGAAHPAQGGKGHVPSAVAPWHADYAPPPVDIFTPKCRGRGKGAIAHPPQWGEGHEQQAEDPWHDD